MNDAKCSLYRSKALAAGLAGVLAPGQPQPLDRAEHVEGVPKVLFGDALVQVGHQATPTAWNHFARIHPFLQHHYQPGRSQRLQDWPGLYRETHLEQLHGGPGVRQQGAGRQA